MRWKWTTATRPAPTRLPWPSGGTEEQPALYLDENMFYNWKCLGSLTPLPRGKVMPKLAKMGIPMTILTELSSTQLTEILCLVCIILYDTKAQGMGIPHYVPGPYRNRALTSDMALEKIRLTFPATHFSILRNPDFFSVDILACEPHLV